MKHFNFRPYIRMTVFAAIIVVFSVLLAVTAGSIGQKARDKEADILKDAITSAAAVCYSIEGRYPADLQYIIDNYGVKVNSAAYIVSYEAFAENLMPDIRVISKEAAR